MLRRNRQYFHYCSTVAMMLALSGGVAMAQGDAQQQLQEQQEMQRQQELQQQQEQAAPPEAAQQQSASPSDTQLQSYAKATVQMRKVVREAQASQSPQAMQGVQKQEEQILQSNGLSIQQYNTIGAASQTDSQVRAKITKYMQQYGGQ